MAPTLILIRHAEALHNYTVSDPPLSPFGVNTQCTTLSNAIQNHPLSPKIDLIVTSPLLRTLQTVSTSLSFLTSRGVPVIALAELQETSVNRCDIGRPVSELENEFPGFDFSLVDPIFPAKEGIFEFSQEALTARGLKMRKWLKERKERVVVVVSHDGFLRVGLCQRKFGNADFRIFEFEEENEKEGRDGLKLVEWEETEVRGGGLGASSKGTFGWLPNDFKYMPKKPANLDGE